MKSKWFVVFLPALMVALLLIPLTVPGFASEEPVSTDLSEKTPMAELSEEVVSGAEVVYSDASGGDAEIIENVCEANGHQYRDGYGACTVCAATPEPASPGDMNGQGGAETTDVVSLMKFVLGVRDSISARPDVNGDGKLGLDDIIYFLRYLMGDVSSIVSDPYASPAYWREAATTE